MPSEYNKGIEINEISRKRQEWDKLYTNVLKKTKGELNHCIDYNEPPVFQYPPVQYGSYLEGQKLNLEPFLTSVFTKNKNRSIITVIHNARQYSNANDKL